MKPFFARSFFALALAALATSMVSGVASCAPNGATRAGAGEASRAPSLFDAGVEVELAPADGESPTSAVNQSARVYLPDGQEYCPRAISVAGVASGAAGANGANAASEAPVLFCHVPDEDPSARRTLLILPRTGAGAHLVQHARDHWGACDAEVASALPVVGALIAESDVAGRAGVSYAPCAAN